MHGVGVVLGGWGWNRCSSIGVVLGGWGWDGCTVWGWCWGRVGLTVPQFIILVLPYPLDKTPRLLKVSAR